MHPTANTHHCHPPWWVMQWRMLVVGAQLRHRRLGRMSIYVNIGLFPNFFYMYTNICWHFCLRHSCRETFVKFWDFINYFENIIIYLCNRNWKGKPSILSMEFSLLIYCWVGMFEKVILFYVFSCGLEKIALIGSKNGQTPNFTVVSINYPELCPDRVSI